jgi:transcription initiation factor TFIIIB Brf1 subunit/transcription initiation factor TFIIB
MMTTTEPKRTNKTKKIKKVYSHKEKIKLWNSFSILDPLTESADESTHESIVDKSLMEGSSAEEKGLEMKDFVVDTTKENGDLCYLCNSTLMVMEDGFPTCSNNQCAIIYKNTLDYSPEWRFFSAEDKGGTDPTRCGNPINPLLKESSFGCQVLCGHNASYEMKKIRRWTEWQSMPHKEKALYDEFQFITAMAQKSGIPKIFIDDAMIIHKDISEQKMFRGLNRDGIKSASIYISCRLNGCPRTSHEIAEIFSLDKASATNGCSVAVNILHNIERNMDPSQQTDLCKTTPTLFIERFCSKLNVNQELTFVAKFIANKVERENIIDDNTPHAIAGGIIHYIAFKCNLPITKTDIKLISGVSEVTINKCFKKLVLLNLIPSVVLEKYTST